MNTLEKSRKKIKIKFLLGILFFILGVILLILLILFFVPFHRESRPKDANIIAGMYLIRGAAEDFYSNNGTYTGLCSFHDVATLKTDIIAEEGSSWTCRVNTEGSAYCIYVQMNSEQWWCVDSTMNSQEYSKSPSGTCSTSFFTCQ